MNHTLKTSVVPLSSLGEPTIPASRGKLYLSLKGYFEVDDGLRDKYGELETWEIRGNVQPAISFSSCSNCGKDGYRNIRGTFRYTTYYPYEMLAEGDGDPSDAFQIFLNIDTLTVEDMKNFIDVMAISAYANTVGIHDLRYTAGGSLILVFERQTVTKSFNGILSQVRFEYTRDGRIIFFDSAEIDRVTSESTGLSVIVAWFDREPKVRF